MLEGAVRTIIAGIERRYDWGETFEVPAGTLHQMTGDGPARVRWQVTPALRTAEFFEPLHSGRLESLDQFRREIRFSAA